MRLPRRIAISAVVPTAASIVGGMNTESGSGVHWLFHLSDFLAATESLTGVSRPGLSTVIAHASPESGIFEGDLGWPCRPPRDTRARSPPSIPSSFASNWHVCLTPGDRIQRKLGRRRFNSGGLINKLTGQTTVSTPGPETTN